MRLLAPSITLLASAILVSGALAATDPVPDTAASQLRVTLKTSLGPIEKGTEADEAGGVRALRATGSVPAGSSLTVRFYRGSKRLRTRRVTLSSTRKRYSTSYDIDRTGNYRVRVTARPPQASKLLLRASAKLEYGPGAQAPSAPGNTLAP